MKCQSLFSWGGGGGGGGVGGGGCGGGGGGGGGERKMSAGMFSKHAKCLTYFVWETPLKCNLQTVQTQLRCHRMRYLIRVYNLHQKPGISTRHSNNKNLPNTQLLEIDRSK